MIAINIILFAIYNGLIIRWQQGKDSATLWHVVSFALRFSIVLMASSIGEVLLYSVLAWGGYNTIINLVMGLKWNYFGKYDFIKGWLYYVLNSIILITGLVLTFIY